MTSADTTSSAAQAQRQDPWPRRVLRTSTFAIVLSLGIHALLLVGFYHAVFREENDSRKNIIPETRLLARSGRTQHVRSEPLRIARDAPAARPQPTQVTPDSIALPDVKLAYAPDPAEDIEPLPMAPARSSGLTDADSGQSDGMQTRLFGVVGNAHRVVYVVDVSISLSLVAGMLKQELRHSIDTLTPAQSFQIVLAKPFGKIDEFTDGQLVPALSSHKQKAQPFIDNMFSYTRPRRDELGDATSGGADPIRAMTRAFAARPRPELIYFLTDGSYQNLEQRLLDHLDSLNADREVRITVICLPGDVFNPNFLREIAKRHGGHYREVRDR